MGERTTMDAVGSVEVVFSWRDASGHLTPLDAELVERDRCPAVWIGVHRGLRFLLPAELERFLDADGRFRLVGIEDGRFVLSLPPGGSITLAKAGATVALEPSARALALEVGHEVEVRLGDFSFHVRAGAAAEKADRGLVFDWSALRWGFAAFAFHAILLGTFFLAPPNAAALNTDLDARMQRFVQVQMLAAAADREPPPTEAAGGDAGGGASVPDEAAGGGDGTPTPHVAGGPGTRSGSARRGEASPVTRESVSTLGTFAALASAIADMSGDTSPFGNPLLAEGPGGPGFQALVGGPGLGGWGGLGMRDAGRGTCLGPSCGTGTVASGPLSTSGDVGPGGVGTGVDLDGRRSPRVPPGPRPGPVTTTGGLSREDVQRTVRRHINEVRFCYQQELQRRPDLEGRVAVQFLIAPDGRVMSSSLASSSGTVGEVGECVATSVRRWTFPSTEGPTSVTYPFVLQSAN